ncbi:hypothetical protein [uncultured Pseudoteredinibacter sp.]|uniref:hypothetical protein n=1 Tax=uncultured Pseudoteredinibacter sp. TaxID=1641701 RepID=UPI00261B924A|nr:hypothetical protein [uncultured Pseudoteredinibacter sp.]
MSNQTQRPSPSSFIGQARSQLKQELSDQLLAFIAQHRPAAPAKSNVWIEECKRDLQLMLRSSRARKAYLPPWPLVLIQMQNKGQKEQLHTLNDYLVQELLNSNPKCKLSALDEQQVNDCSIDTQASKMLLPALKASFQASREVAPQLHQHYWLYLNFNLSIGRHLALHKLGHSFTVNLISCMQLAGAICCLRYLATALRKRPDQSDAIEWLAYNSLENIAPELSQKIAKDWQLSEEICQSLSTAAAPESLLSKTLEDCEIASCSCLLFNQEIISEEAATHYLRQWQLPTQLLRQFAPRK